MLITVIIFAVSLIVAPFFVIALSPTRGIDSTLLPTLSKESLIESVQNMAREDALQVIKQGDGVFSKQLKRITEKAYIAVALKEKRGEKLLSHERIFLSDYYKISERIAQIKNGELYSLPHVFGVPRIVKLCSFVVKSLAGAITEEAITETIEAYNEISPLTFAELRALPVAVNYALCELVTSIANRTLNSIRRFNEGKTDGKKSRIAFNKLKSNSYLLGALTTATDKTRKLIASFCDNNGIKSKDATLIEKDKSVAYGVTLSASIRSLFAVDEYLTDELILTLSPTVTVLSADQTFSNSTTKTKLSYLNFIQEKARRKRVDERSIAIDAIRRAREKAEDLSSYIFPKEKGGLYRFFFVFSRIFTAFLLSIIVLFAFGITESILSFPILAVLSNEILDMLWSKNTVFYSLPAFKSNKGALITFTRLVCSKEEAEEAIFSLKTLASANTTQAHAFALLVDLPPSTNAMSENDETIITTLKQGFKGLDQKFNLFIRKRVKCGKEWRGYERKRGALIALNQLILFNDRSPFLVVEGKTYEKEFVITLDSDTMLDCADELVAIMEHPFNKSATVVSLNMKTSPFSYNSTLFSRLMSGGVGLDGYSYPYAHLSSRLFNAGNFTGKGIYRVKEFNEKTANAFPNERILSHDFIEGAFSGCKNCDLEALDSFPSTPQSYFVRAIRWLRGDIQLIPYLFPFVKNKSGKWIKNPIGIINAYHLITNINFALLPVSCVALLLLNALSLSAGAIIVALYFTVKILLIAPSIIKYPKIFLKNFCVILYSLALLPVQGIYNLIWIVITIYRLIKGTNLLSWKVSAQGGSIDLALPQILYTVAFFTCNLFFGNDILCYVFCIFFVTVVPLNFLLSEKITSKKNNERTRLIAEFIAQKTWRYFESSHKIEFNFLPPDNFDERENFGYATRTSPTDIGMSLVACYCAHKLAIISKEKAEEFVGEVLEGIKKLEKWRGNLYNWYDIKTLSTLPPKFVSFVDSGNFLCSLLLIEEIVCEKDKEYYEQLIRETDLSVFYDTKKGLAFNGYNETEKRFDGHYDLVASESSISYLLAIALGVFPRKSWQNLSHRAFFDHGTVLASWTGGAFEYLLCPQFFSYQKGTLYYESALNSVKGQIRYAIKNDLPAFGISESQYRAFEDNGDYKYKAFGVPTYSLSNANETKTLSPYSAVLSLRFEPERASAVLSYYIENGALGKYGLYEAFDTAPIRTYMAHHQGMIMLGLTNYLEEDCVIKTLATRPEIKATELLLSRPSLTVKPPKKLTLKYIPTPRLNEVFTGERRERNRYFLYEKADYRMAIDCDGNGFSLYKNLFVTAKREGTGMLIFAKIGNDEYSLTANSYSTFTNEYANYEKRTRAFFSTVKARVLSNGVGEEREVTLRNLTDETLTVLVSSYAELTLGNSHAQSAHREYYNMFTRTELLSAKNAVVAKREGFYAVHSCSEKAEFNTSRRAYYSRSEEIRFGAVLDPIFSAEVELRVHPGEQKTLHFYTLVGFDESKLLSTLALSKTYGYFSLYSCETMLDGYTSQIFSDIEGAVGSTKNATIPDKTLPVVVMKRSPNAQRNHHKISALCSAVRFGARFTLAIIYKESEGYYQKIRREVERLVESSGLNGIIPIILVNEFTQPDKANEITKNALPLFEENRLTPFALTVKSKPLISKPLTAPKLILPLGIGGFTENGDYYADLTMQTTPKPWSVVLANAKFGTIITESGGGYTFSDNSREKKITAWNNDSALDIPSESVLLCENSLCWSATKNPVKTNGYYSVLFSKDYITHSCSFNAIITTLTQFVGNGKCKYYSLELQNSEEKERTLSVCLAVDIVLGDEQRKTAHALVGKREENRLVMRNAVSGAEAVIDCTERLTDYAFNRKVLLSTSGNYAKLTGLENDIKGTSLVYSVKIALPPLSKKTIVFSLSEGDKYDLDSSYEILQEKIKRRGTLCPVSIKTNELPLDLLYSWLPTQTLDCRYFARSGFYQSGGAFGFRDQLQDCLAIMYFAPSLVREHILKCAARQFEKGDVLHWWHEPYLGVRTRITDDRLFLPIVTSEYIRFTGDASILRERISYLKNLPIPSGSPTLYTQFEPSDKKATLLDHCVKAIDGTALNEQGLALIGGGDWNDAMDEVGNKGKGTSVFVTMLLYLAIKKIARFLTNEQKSRYAQLLVKLKNAVENEWEDDRYHRATTDEGVVLGSKTSPECKIDLLTQAFATLSGVADDERAKIALQTAYDTLFDKRNGIVKLLDPPFKKMKVGYISTYPEGIRENGGQYTHATIWFITALLKVGETERAWEIFSTINPVNRCKTVESVQKYKNEPFVLSADIYSADRAGEGGWSWYTGSAGWAFKLITEGFFGLELTAKTLKITPALPACIPTATLTYKKDEVCVKIVINNQNADGEWTLKVDETTYSTPLLTLSPSLNGRKITVTRCKK